MAGWVATLMSCGSVDRDAEPVALLTPVPEGRMARAEAAVRGLPEPVKVIGSAVGRVACFVADLFF